MTEGITLAKLCRASETTHPDKPLIILSVLLKLEKEGIITSEMERTHDGCNGEWQWVRTYKKVER